MKYLYQQLLAFIGVIALIILIVGTSFTIDQAHNARK